MGWRKAVAREAFRNIDDRIYVTPASGPYKIASGRYNKKYGLSDTRTVSFMYRFVKIEEDSPGRLAAALANGPTDYVLRVTAYHKNQGWHYQFFGEHEVKTDSSGARYIEKSSIKDEFLVYAGYVTNSLI